MACLGVSSPLHRFRRTTSHPHQPLHERWGDPSISSPADGAWSQVHDYDSDNNDNNINNNNNNDNDRMSPMNRASFLPRQPLSSFTMNTLNPARRLSIRLKPRPKSIAAPPSPSLPHLTRYKRPQQHPLVERRKGERVHEEAEEEQEEDQDRKEIYNNQIRQEPNPRHRHSTFIYKPICQDYPTIVAETTTSSSTIRNGTTLPSPPPPNNHRRSSQHVPRFQYIPTHSQYGTSFRQGRRPRSSFMPSYSVRSEKENEVYDEDEEERDQSLKYQPEYVRGLYEEEEEDYDNDDHERRMSLFVMEKRQSRSSRRLTTIMVPNSEELYS